MKANIHPVWVASVAALSAGKPQAFDASPTPVYRQAQPHAVDNVALTHPPRESTHF